MARYVFSRFLQAIAVILAAYTLTFVMIRSVKGDPFTGERALTESVRKQMEKNYGLDKPRYVQYFVHLGSYLKGDFLPSMKYPGTMNSKLIKDSFPVSLSIGLTALLIALGIGLPAGILAAVKKNSWVDYGVMSLAMAGICLPTFVLGPLLIAVFGLKLGWFSVAGWFEPTDWVLPAATLGIVTSAYIARLTRGGMLEVLNQDFIRTARAKGVPGWRIVLVHALRGGLLPVVAYLGPALAGITTGSFIIEKIFQIPGLGWHFISSVNNRDYTLVQALAIFFSTLVVTANFLTDLLQAWLNPKVRMS